jgi:hypothetical protein
MRRAASLVGTLSTIKTAIAFMAFLPYVLSYSDGPFLAQFVLYMNACPGLHTLQYEKLEPM